MVVLVDQRQLNEIGVESFSFPRVPWRVIDEPVSFVWTELQRWADGKNFRLIDDHTIAVGVADREVKAATLDFLFGLAFNEVNTYQLPSVKVYVVTEKQSKSAKRWWSRASFPSDNTACCGLVVRGHDVTQHSVMSGLKKLGREAEWNEWLNALIVTAPHGSLVAIGAEIERTLSSCGWSSRLVNNLSRDSV
jgi:hypothetical protein